MTQSKKDKKLLIVASFEDVSILNKFAILFLVASIIPVGLVFYMYTEHSQNFSDLSENSFTVAIIFMIVGVLVGFAAMRKLLLKIINISKQNSKALQNLLSPDTIKELQGENEIVVLSRSFSAVTKQLEENIQNLEATKKTLQSVMVKVGQGISNMGNINAFLQLIVETTANALNAKVGALLVLEYDKKRFVVKNVFGFELPSEPIYIMVDQPGPLKDILVNKRPAVIAGHVLTHGEDKAMLLGDQVLCVPMLFQERMSGIITLSREGTSHNPFSDDDIDLVANLASQTAVALENFKLNHDIEKTYFETVSALALAVDAKDKYSRGHLDRVSDYAAMIGKHMGLTETELNTLRDAARLHDLGKIGIPDEVLRKDGQLTSEEWAIMKRHPEIGESIIKPVHSLQHLCDLVRHHHEKLDGTGYPDGLKGDEISLLVRILSVADVYDALTTERPYRGKKSKQEAARILRSMKNHVDQEIVEAFLTLLDQRPEKLI